MRSGLFRTACQANPGNHVVGLADRFDIQIRLVNRPGEQQTRTAYGQLLAIGTVATVIEAQLATGVHVVANMHLPRQIGVQAKAGEGQQLLPHHHVDIHVDLHRRGFIRCLLAHDNRVIRDLDCRWRQFTHHDFALGHVHRTGDQQGVIRIEGDFQVRGHFQLGIGFDRHRQIVALDQHIDRHRLAPGHIAADAALAFVTAGPAAIDQRRFTVDGQ